MTVHELAGAAVQIMSAACEARAALTKGASPRREYDAARKALAPFGAELIARADVAGMVVGVRFHSGRFTSGALTCSMWRENALWMASISGLLRIVARG